ncbi:LysR family transcriptional regulator [Pseudorhodoferax soli]|uniref:Transcriptional regulator n=1 Tax=Pseudorhodoferax soli TaxID=545864 RepID=A0A368XL28_9BURK|nr:LysR family transcriptional regulator [Pseudorhodoferax soli]RCW68673.1 transcriptional regulator [Pseudorhodoferax soli]
MRETSSITLPGMRLSTSLSRLELFVKVINEGSLSNAARALALTPSAVSKSLSQLESQLGTTLVKRTSRHLSLTEGGATLYERAKTILQEADAALHATLQYRKPSGVLRVTCSIALGCTQISRLVREFISLYPDIELSLNLDDRIADLSAADHDVALRITSRDDWDYVGRRLAPIQWIYAASPGYLASRPAVRVPQDLAVHCCLLYPAMTEKRQWSFFHDGEELNVKVPCRAVSNSSLALAEMATDGSGVVCIPDYVAHRYLNDGSLVEVLPAYAPQQRHALYALYTKTRYSNPALRAFVDFLADKFEDGVPWNPREGSGRTQALSASARPATAEGSPGPRPASGNQG